MADYLDRYKLAALMKTLASIGVPSRGAADQPGQDMLGLQGLSAQPAGLPPTSRGVYPASREADIMSPSGQETSRFQLPEADEHGDILRAMMNKIMINHLVNSFSKAKK